MPPITRRCLLFLLLGTSLVFFYLPSSADTSVTSGPMNPAWLPVSVPSSLTSISPPTVPTSAILLVPAPIPGAVVSTGLNVTATSATLKPNPGIEMNAAMQGTWNEASRFLKNPLMPGVNDGSLGGTDKETTYALPDGDASALDVTPTGQVLLRAGGAAKIGSYASPGIRIGVAATGENALDLTDLAKEKDLATILNTVLRQVKSTKAEPAVKVIDGKVFLKAGP